MCSFQLNLLVEAQMPKVCEWVFEAIHQNHLRSHYYITSMYNVNSRICDYKERAVRRKSLYECEQAWKGIKIKVHAFLRNQQTK